MNRILLAALLLAPATLPAQADTIRRLDSLWARMYQTHDTVTADRLYADDVVITATQGTLKTKAQEMADVRPYPGMTVEYFRTSGAEVRVLGAAAVVTGQAEWKFTSNGNTSEVKRRYTMVYARGGPLGWRIVTVHIGRAP
jgi:ketosteroid isomerase-like protein